MSETRLQELQRWERYAEALRAEFPVMAEMIVTDIRRQIAELTRDNHKDAERWRFARAHGLIWADRCFPTSSPDGIYHGHGTATPGQVGGEYADTFIDYRMRQAR